MDLTHDHPSGLWRRGRRVVVVLGAAALLIAATSFIKPAPQGAHASVDSDTRTRNVRHEPQAARSTVAPHPKGWKLLGTLEGREHILKCWGTNDGPRYSVHALDGRLIQDDLPADEVYRGFPDIDLPNLRTDPPTSAGTLVDFVDVWRD